MRPRITVASGIALATLSILASCGGGGGGGSAATSPAPTWLVMVYMAADNSLESLAPTTIAAMEAALPSPSVKVIVQVDTTTDPVNGSTTTKRLEISSGAATTVQDLGETNSATGAAVTSFAQWAVANYPADRHVLVLWDHGGQWIGWGVDDTGGGPSGMDYAGLKAMFSDIQAATGIAKFDLIGFDSCLMAGLEIDLMLSDFATYRVSSCASELGAPWMNGLWDYQYWLTALASHPKMAFATLGKSICDGFIAQRNAFSIGNQTLSVANLTKTSALVDALDTLAGHLQGLLLSPTLGDYVPVASARDLSPEYDAKPLTPGTIIDLRAFASRLAVSVADRTIVAEANAVIKALNAEIIYKVQGVEEPNHGGCSIYFPTDVLNSQYTSSVDLGSGSHQWAGFLNAYLAANTVDTIAPAVAILSPPDGTSVPVTIDFTIDGVDDPADIFDVSLLYLTQTGSTMWLIQGDQDAGNLEPGEWLATWDGTSFSIWDGTSPHSDWLCALSPHVASGLYLAFMQYVGAASNGVPIDVVVSVKLDWEIGGIGSIEGFYAIDANGTDAPIDVLPGDEITPYNVVLDTSTASETFELASQTLTIPANGYAGLTIAQTSLGSGPHAVGIFVKDYAGNASSAFGVFNIP